VSFRWNVWPLCQDSVEDGNAEAVPAEVIALVEQLDFVVTGEGIRIAEHVGIAAWHRWEIQRHVRKCFRVRRALTAVAIRRKRADEVWGHRLRWQILTLACHSAVAG